jgi:hypothetical protein
MPVIFQILSRCNTAFPELFGSAPPPGRPYKPLDYTSPPIWCQVRNQHYSKIYVNISESSESYSEYLLRCPWIFSAFRDFLLKPMNFLISQQTTVVKRFITNRLGTFIFLYLQKRLFILLYKHWLFFKLKIWYFVFIIISEYLLVKETTKALEPVATPTVACSIGAAEATPLAPPTSPPSPPPPLTYKSITQKLDFNLIRNDSLF